MAASKPTYLKNKNYKSFSLNINLRALAYDQGCFPFDTRPSRRMSVCLFFLINAIKSFTGFKERKTSPLDQ